MVPALFSSRARLRNLHAVLERVAECFDSGISIRLWDGSVNPLGPNADPNLCLAIHGPGVIGSLLRRPTLDNLITLYASGRLEVQGPDLYTFAEQARVRQARDKLRKVSKLWLAWKLLPFVFCRSENAPVEAQFAGEAGIGQTADGRANKDFIQFHYDAGNDFYELFLDEQMQYSCGYFADWDDSLDHAQEGKLDITCRKLGLQPDETLLDVGCGWGGLLCHAAQRYGVRAHGLTLSQRQLEYVEAKVRRLGLEDRVTVELRDAFQMTGTYDKVVSIGMIEHVGISNQAALVKKMWGVLRDRGTLLLQLICRGAKPAGRNFRKSRPEHRLIRKYIFPGGELGNVGELVQALEASRFEVHDVEGWREHYALTLKHWSQRLAANEREAIRLVGVERYRLWMAYLVGMSLGFGDGTLRVFQVLSTKHEAKGPSGRPGTRDHLYTPLPAGLRSPRAAVAY